MQFWLLGISHFHASHVETVPTFQCAVQTPYPGLMQWIQDAPQTYRPHNDSKGEGTEHSAVKLSHWKRCCG